MLYAFAFGLQLILLVFRLSRVTRAHHSRTQITLWVVEMFVRAAPPSIPTIFLVLTHIARTRLDRAGLSLLFSKALRTGANINMVCFDKTGTLTDSVVRCVLAVDLPCFSGENWFQHTVPHGQLCTRTYLILNLKWSRQACPRQTSLKTVHCYCMHPARN